MLISKSPTKKVFPVEHFGADPLGDNSARACQRAHNFLKAPLRGGEAIRAIAREKSPPNSEKNGFEPVFEHPGFEPFFLPPWQLRLGDQSPSRSLLFFKAPLRGARSISTVP